MTRRMLVCLLALLILPSSTMLSMDYPAAGCSALEIQDAYDDAVANYQQGDTVTVPNGTCTWTGTDQVTLGAYSITVQGSGSTVLINNTSTGTMFSVVTDGTARTRLTNIELQGDALSTGGNVINITGDGTAFRIDNNTFRNLRHTAVRVHDAAYGLIDNNEIIESIAGLGGGGWFLVTHEDYPCTAGGSVCTNPTTATAGHGNWANALPWGTANAVFVERNTFTNTTANPRGVCDAEQGGNVVFRFNTLTNMYCTVHGTEGGATRGTSSLEAYENTLAAVSGSNSAFHVRSGSSILFNNAVTGSGTLHFEIVYTQYRLDNGVTGSTTNLGAKCDGYGGFDNNGTVQETGVASSGSNSQILTVSGDPWTAGQWASVTSAQRFGVKNTTTGKAGIIYANTEGQIFTPKDHILTGAGDSQPLWTTGDGYEIKEILACMDNHGWHGGKLLVNSGGVPGPSGWVEQTNQPSYAWNNTQSGVVTMMREDRTQPCTEGGCPTPMTVTAVVHNRDVYNEAGSSNLTCSSAFDGTCGVGVGALAARPLTCTAGVAYWATDQGGNWNTLTAAANDGALYKCTATDTWTLFYTPYTYPHPLSAAEGEDPPVPSITSITPSFGNRNSTVPVVIAGSGFSIANATINEGCAGLSIENIVVNSDVELEADVVMTAGATIGACPLTVETDNGESSPEDFEVIDASAPVLSTITPESGLQASSVPIALAGTGLTGATMSVSGSGITVTNPVVSDDNNMTATFVLAPGTAVTPRDVTVTTGTGTSNPKIFTVSFNGPSVTSGSPLSATPGTSVGVSLTGLGFSLSSFTLTIADPLSVVDLVIHSDSSLGFTTVIPPDAPLGDYAIVITTINGSTASDPTLFSVVAGPPTVTNPPGGPPDTRPRPGQGPGGLGPPGRNRGLAPNRGTPLRRGQRGLEPRR